jgi:hypothetical protein
VFAEMLLAARELLAVRTPLDAELMVSDMLGAWWGRRLRQGDVEEFLGEGLVDYAAKAGTPAALTLLVAVAYLGTARQAAKAEGAALALMESDVARPRWAERVGAVKPQGCYVSRDAYGDQDTVVCTFAYRGGVTGQTRHAGTAPASADPASPVPARSGRNTAGVAAHRSSTNGHSTACAPASSGQEPPAGGPAAGPSGPDLAADPAAPAQGPAEDAHALVVIVDYNMRGMARDAWVSSQVEELLEKADVEAAGRFTEAYRDPTTFGLDRSLVERLLPDGDLSALPRRAFAFPFLEGMHGTVDLSALRPAEDADRRILLEIDHAAERDRPDYAEHLAWHEEIAKRLWDGDPEQMWEAAQRLLDLGHDRHDVLHVLMEIAERIGDHPDELAAALDDIADIPDEPPG